MATTAAQLSSLHAADQFDRLDDLELLKVMRSLPSGRGRRAAACDVLVGRYGKLVRACVRRYMDSPEPTEDLMQVGYVGLLKAINNFDPEVGSNLSAYAQPCITGEIKRHFRDKRWQVHVRRAAQELLLETKTATEVLTQRLGRDPSEAELASYLGVTERELLEARRADVVFHVYSLDAPLSDRDDSSELADVLGGEDPKVQHAVDMGAVTAHWKELPAREQRILLLRFYGNLTQAEIGERLGISQMHVSRLLARALGYLRRCLAGREDEGEGEREVPHLPGTPRPRLPAAGQRPHENHRKGATMRTGTGLTLLAIGAILAFAVTTNTSVFNLHIAGFVFMLTGLAALLLPRRSYTWLNRRVVQRRRRALPNGTIVETRETSYPPYVVANPGIGGQEADLPTSPSIDPDPTVGAVMTPGTPDSSELDPEVIERLRDE